MTQRFISIGDLEAVQVKVGQEPELGFVDVSKLFVDEAYQRSIEKRGWSNIRKIAENFDWAKFSPLIVSKRPEGNYAIIDGQHRAHAAALCGIDSVPAMISQLSMQQEASAFSWINGSVTALTANQIFKAALAAYEPWATQCDTVVRSAGCRLMQYNKNSAHKRPGEVFCIGLVRSAVDAGHAQHLAAVLEGVSASPKCGDVAYYGAYGLAPLLAASVEAGVTRPQVIADFIGAHDLENVAERVRRLQDLPEHRGRTFKSLFSKSVIVLLKNFSAGAA